ncbi:hypothetical protein QFZ96_008119 [Paraburkholderia youngii]
MTSRTCVRCNWRWKVTATLPDIERALRMLRLSGVRDTLETRVLQAHGTQQPFLETFAMILQDELDRRQSRLIERRYRPQLQSSCINRSARTL